MVLVGEGVGPKWDAKLSALGWGRMFVQKRPSPYPGEPWGWDNGAFIAWRRGVPLDRGSVEASLRRALPAGQPLLAVVPDVVAGGLESLTVSLSWLPLVRELAPAWPWYLAVQDGMTPADVEPLLDNFAGIFLGGTTAFKAQALSWRRFAHAHGRPFHYGRAGTLAKLEHAWEIGADSCDSAFPMWTVKRFAAFAEHWRERPQITFGMQEGFNL